MNLYFESAKCLDMLDARRGSVKSVLSFLPAADRSRGAALLIETLKYKTVLIAIIEKSQLLQLERKHLTSLNLALLLVHDLLFGRGIQASNGPVKQAVKRHKSRLQAELVRFKIAKGITKNEELAVQSDVRSGNIPRYARVNECLWDIEEAINYFEENGFSLCSDPVPRAGQFAKDQHIPNLLVFNTSSSLHQTDAYLAGRLILQDKASCIPAVVLVPPFSNEVEVIDATAAPGNKTTHLSALMCNKGKIYAFERDKSRFKVLKMMLQKAGCKNVSAMNADFLTVDPNDAKYAKVAYILLDPSCSGSGIVNRLDYLLETENETNEESKERLNKLAAFQLSMIMHAMAFPSVKRIVYSTCSIYATENELVVRNVIRSDTTRKLGFKLANRSEVLPDWNRRGLPGHLGTEAEDVIRCSPAEDHTNGFFVSLFVRDTDGDSHNLATTGVFMKRKGVEEPIQQGKKRAKRRRLGS